MIAGSPTLPAEAMTPEEERLCAEVLANPSAHPASLVQWCLQERERGESGISTPTPPAPPDSPTPPSSPDPSDPNGNGKPGYGNGDKNHGHEGPPGQSN